METLPGQECQGPPTAPRELALSKAASEPRRERSLPQVALDSASETIALAMTEATDPESVGSAEIPIASASSAAPKKRWYLWPFKDPWSGFGTWLGTVLGAIALYLTYGQDAPRITYAVAPSRARIVVAGQTSDLRVLHAESEITTDVTAAQVALWNNGKRSVEIGDVLEPVRLVMEPRVPILEARWRQVTRAVCALDLDRSHAKEGELAVRFAILEKDDGGILQVIYAGPPDVAIRMVGVVKGQRELALPATKVSTAMNRAVAWGSALFLIALPVLFVIGGAASLWNTMRREGYKKAVKEALGVLLVVAFVLIVIILFAFVSRLVGPSRPPFPF